MTTTGTILRQLEALIDRYEKADPRVWDPNGDWVWRDLNGLLSSAMAAIERLSPLGSAYTRLAAEIVQSERHSLPHQLEGLIGIVDALRHDYQSGALAPLRELIRAEVFDDFLDMAEHLLESGYKDSAAVLVAGVLESELRKLAQRAEVPTTSKDGRPLKADALNASLAAQSVYNKLDQKSVTSWLDLRNNAAHARYDEYTKDHVVVMLMGVRSFVSRLSSTAL